MAVTVLFVGVSTWLSMELNIWIDEAYSLQTTDSGLIAGIAGARFHRQAPMYFGALSAVRTLSPTILAARSLSIFSMAAFLVLVFFYSRRQWGSREAILLVLLAAVHPFSLWAATEVRPYAFALAVGALLIYVEGHTDRAIDASHWKWSFFKGLLWAAALYAHYYLGFLLAALVVASVISDPRRWREIAIASVTCAVVFGPFVPTVLSQTSNANADMPSASALGSMRIVYGHAKAFAFPFVRDLPDAVSTWFGYSAIALATILASLKRAYRSRRVIAVVSALATSTTCYVAAGVLVGPQAIDTRHTFVLFIVIIAAAGAVLHFLRMEARSNRAFGILGLVLMLCFVAATAYRNAPLAKEGDYRRAAQYIKDSESAGQPIVLFNSEAVLPFSYYYEGINLVVPLPSHPSVEEFDPAQFSIESYAQVSRRMSDLPAQHTHIWLYDNQVRGWGNTRYNWKYLDRYLGRHYTVERYAAFFGAEVRLLARNATR